MKVIRHFYCFFVWLMIGITSINAQQDSSNKKHHFILKADVGIPALVLAIDLATGGSILKNGNLETFSFETCFGKRQSFQLSSLFINDPGSDHWMEIIPEYKYYPFKDDFYSSMYFGIYCKYAIDHEVTGFGPINDPAFYQYDLGEGILFGYQKDISKHIVLDFFWGFGAMKINTRNVYFPSYSNFDVMLAVNIGYKF